MSFLKRSGILAIGNILPRLSTFIILPLLTGTLSKVEYGRYDLILILTTLLAPNLILQIQSAAFRFLIDASHDKDRAEKIITTSIFFVLVMSFVSFLGISIALTGYNALLRLLVASYVFLVIWFDYFQQISRGLGKTLNFSISAVANAVFNVIFLAPLLSFTNLGLTAALLGFILSTIVSIIILEMSNRTLTYVKPTSFSLNFLRDMLSYSVGMIPNSVSFWIVNMADRLIITMMVGLSALAVYAVSTKIPQMLSVLQNTFTMAWQEEASLSRTQLDKNKIYSRIFDNLVSVAFGGAFLIFGFLLPMFGVLINHNYIQALNQIPILILAMAFYMISSFFGGIYVAEMNVKRVATTTILSAVVKITITLIFIKSIGLFAASIGTLISYVILDVIRYFDTKKYVSVDINFTKMLLLIPLIGLAYGLFLQHRYILSSVLSLFVGTLLLKNVATEMVKKIMSGRIK